MFDEFKSHIDNNIQFLDKTKLLIACSGGLDSVVLTHLCDKLNLNIALAHCNFNLREKESDADESFVFDLADRLDLEVFVEHFNTETFAKEEKLSIQMAARELRYDWFYDLAENLGFNFILTAHHADDNLETFLINLSRGTGLNGLTGIPEINDKLIRPLLPFSREDLESYAKLNHIKWREDSSNASDKYLRNTIRHHVIPALKAANSDLLKNFKKTLSHLNDSADIVDDSINALTKRALVSINDEELKFKISELKQVNNQRAYLFELLKDYGFTDWDDTVNLLDAQSGKQIISPTHRLIKNREHLILTERNHNSTEDESEEILNISEGAKKIQTPIGILSFEDVAQRSKSSNKTIYVDKAKLKYPLVMRHWEKGDVFHPLGMSGKKKLSKFYKDQKLSIIDKEKVWLLCSNNKIIWVVGMRADDRFKLTEITKHILKITIQ